jgi:hypothetical protein
LRAFISYSHRDDAAVAHSIRDALEREGVDVWRDETITFGDSIASRLLDAVKDADVFVALITKASAASEWTRAEIAGAIAAQARESKPRILPVILDDNIEIPLFLRTIQGLNATNLPGAEVARSVASAAITLAENRDSANVRADLEARRQVNDIEISEVRRAAISLGSRNTRRNQRLAAFLVAIAATLSAISVSVVTLLAPGNSPAKVALAIGTAPVLSVIAAVAGFYFGSARTGDE